MLMKFHQQENFKIMSNAPLSNIEYLDVAPALNFFIVLLPYVCKF